MPRGALLRELEGDASESSGWTGRGHGWLQQSSGGNHVLQAGSSEEGLWAYGLGNAEFVRGPGSADPRKTSTSGRRSSAATEKLRVSAQWNALGPGSKNGAAPERPQQHRSVFRASPCPQGVLLRGEDKLPGIPSVWPEAGWKRSRSRRKERQREERRERKQEQGWRLGRQGEGWQRAEKEVGLLARSEEPLQVRGSESMRISNERRACRAGNGSPPVFGGSGSFESPKLMAGAGSGTLEEFGEGSALEADSSVQFLPAEKEGSKITFPPEDVAGSPRHSGEKKLASVFEGGESLKGVGATVLQSLLEVFVSVPLRSKTTGGRNRLSLFPLPTSKGQLQTVCPKLSDDEMSWLSLVVLGLNSVWGGDLFCDLSANDLQCSCIRELEREVVRWCSIPGKKRPC